MNGSLKVFQRKISNVLVLSLLCGLLSVVFGTLPGIGTSPAFAASGDTGSVKFDEPRTNYLKMDTINSAFGFGLADFTIEFWWKPTVSRRSDTLDFYNLASTNMQRLDIGSNIGTGGVELYTDNGCSIGSGVSLSSILNIWTHVALTRSAGTLYLWINGVQKGSISCNKDFGSTGYSLSIMKDHGAGANGSGYLSNIRVVKGTAVYLTAFTPPTSQLGNIANTSFLLNTVQGSDFLKDSSSNGLTVTPGGSPLSDASSPFADKGSIATYPNGSTRPIYGTFTNVPGNTTAYTVEFWFNTSSTTPPNGSNTQWLFGQEQDGCTGGLELWINSGGHLGGGTNGAGYNSRFVDALDLVSVNTWHHLAIDANSSGATSIFLDGVNVISGGVFTPVAWTQHTWNLGARLGCGSLPGSESGIGYPLAGNVADFRYVLGTQVYTTNFTPPTTPLAAITGTQLLLPMPYDSLNSSTQTLADFSRNYPMLSTVYQAVGVSSSSMSPFVVATTTSLSTSSASPTYGQAVVLKATISSTLATGITSFLDGGTPITGCSSVAVVSGVATCSVSTLILGSHAAITSSYSGDSTFAPSLSPAVASLIVGKATLAVAPSSVTVTFGNAVASYLFSYSGFVNGENASSSSFTTGRVDPVCSSSYTTSTSVSTSPLVISCSGGSATNYQFTYGATANLSITQATPTISAALFAGTPVYGAIDTLTATINVAGNVSFYSGGTAIPGCISVSTTLVAPFSAPCSWVPASVTNYSLTATFTPTDGVDYTTATSSAITPTSIRSPLIVTPTLGQSKVFGSNNPTVSYSITSGALIGSDVLSGALTYTGSNVGSYPITIGTLANPSYTITLASVNFAITQATQSGVTLSSLSSAYNQSNKTVSLTGSGGTGSGTYSYAIDSSNTTAGCSILNSTLTYTTAGTCIVAVTRTSDTNYLARTDVVSFSIGLASQTITFASLSAKTYSSDTFTVTASSTSGLLVIFTSGSTSICTTSGVNGTVINLRDVGLCVINANQPGDANTAAAAQVVQSFTVNPRVITVTADPKSKVYGTPSDPALTYSVTSGSLVLGDSLTGGLTRVTGTDAGSYVILPGTLASANNLKYSIIYLLDYLTITKATPTLVLAYPNSNIVILTPGITDTATVATSSSNGTLAFASPTSVSICSIDATSGVISFTAAGICQIVMTSASTTNYLQASDTETVTSVLQSTSLAGIPSGNLIPMGGTFYASPILTQTVSATVGSNGASVSIPANALPSTTAISISLLTDATTQLALISGASNSVLSVVVSWVSPDGSVPQTSAGNPISVTLTNPSIKAGAKVYSVVGGTSTLVGTATVDGSITSQITSDPVLVVVNPPVVIAPPVVTPPVVISAPVDNSAAQALAAAQAAAKVLAEKQAADDAAKVLAAKQAAELAAKVLADQQAADALASAKAAQDALDAAALKAAQEKMAADAKALADAKAAADAAAVKAAQEAADASAKAAAVLQAAKDAAAAAAKAALLKTPALTLYSLSSKLTLSSYDNAYLQRYVRSLKNGASVTCLGYIYKKGATLAKATALAKSQATAVCTLITKSNKTLKTSIILLDSSKAPKAAVGSKWVAVSYRIDGFKG